MVAFSAARSATGADESSFYVYHHVPKTLSIDSTRIAVRTSPSQTGKVLPTALTTSGFSSSDIIAAPTADWKILNTTSASAKAQQTAPGGTRAIVASLVSSADSSIEFVSPVFKDENGDPLLLEPRILIGFDPKLPPAARQRLLASVPEGASLEKAEFPQPHDERWRLHTRDGFALLARANALARLPGVAYAEPDMMATWHRHYFATDPYFYMSWGLLNNGQSGGLAGFDMKATAAWDITLGNPSVIVVVLDDGVQQNHPDLNVYPGRDFTSAAGTNPSGGPVGPYDNHGTLVAGCISERISNGLGTTGIAPGVRVASARFATNGQSNGSFITDNSWVVNALNWSQSIGAKVTNNSNGTAVPSSAIESAYVSTRNNGLVHFASVGNESKSTITFPANASSVNGVGSVNRHGQRSSFSNYGAQLKFMAPGEEIVTTDRTGDLGIKGDYAIVGGTSFASPYAAGVAALIISRHPGITPAQVEYIMRSTCRDMGTPGFDTNYGYGLLDAAAAVNAAVPVLDSSLTNLSTRLSVQTGAGAAIAGFIIEGTTPKNVLIRLLGPTLNKFGIPNTLVDPVLSLHDSNGILATNDNWADAANAASIPATYRPSSSLESVIVASLLPGSYTAVATGSGTGTGVGLVELYDLDKSTTAKLTNVSTRGAVGTGSEVMIGGFIASGTSGSATVVVRALGPALTQFGIAGVLADPMVALYNSNGVLIMSNDNWKQTQQAALQQSGLAPPNDNESALLTTVPNGNYTAVVSGKNNTTGVALVEIYRR